MTTEVRIKTETERYNFPGVRSGDSGILMRTAYFGHPVFIVRAADAILVLSKDEVELGGGEK
ncbi:MAG: hypothetical protein N2V72_00570 [Methanophagales archaeon]|nr:hypothetical protein [Methanophagales archaeon]